MYQFSAKLKKKMAYYDELLDFLPEKCEVPTCKNQAKYDTLCDSHHRALSVYRRHQKIQKFPVPSLKVIEVLDSFKEPYLLPEAAEELKHKAYASRAKAKK